MHSRRPSFSRTKDWGVAALMAVTGLVAYLSTLAPTVLDGDAALFQYTPSVLGVTYPTGYPTYMLLGHLWKALVPIGSVAYRMNLLSAVCGALALAFVYLALSRLLDSRLGALSATLIFATVPTYWRWATEAKIYTLHILLLSGILFLLTRRQQGTEPSPGRRPLRQQVNLALSALLFGLALGNHSTTVLLAPGLFLLYWLDNRSDTRSTWRSLVRLVPFLLVPAFLYLYVPVRAGWLLAQEGTLAGLTVPVAVARGLVTDYYRPGIGGLIRYFTAADFTGGVTTGWGQVPHNLVTVYWPLVRADFTLWGVALATVGAVYLAVARPRRFWPVFLMYVALIPFVLTYGQGEQSAFLLPSSLMVATFCGAAVAGGWRLIDLWVERPSEPGPSSERPASLRRLLTRGVPSLVLLAAVAWLPIHNARHNVFWLSAKWDDSTYRYWTDALAHPMDQGAGVLAHWGDLTSFWYLQHTDGLRPDLYGLYPPTEAVVTGWLDAGHSLYVAGPLQGWGDRLADDYQLLPWGRLVRVAPRDADPLTLLPDLDAVPGATIFDNRLELLSASFDAQTRSAGVLPVTLTWQTTRTLPADTRISLRLVTEDGTPVAQSDDTLLSGWLSATRLPADQVFLSFHRFKLPAGTLPGSFHLQMALSVPNHGEWLLSDGQSVLDVGEVVVTVADPGQPIDPWDEYKPLRGINFGDEIRLVGYDYSVTRAGQGKGFAARLLWQAKRPPVGDYTLLVELVDGDGRVWRDWHHAPANGRAPTSTWATGQAVRDQVDLVLPADTPPGDNTMRTRLSWLRPDGSRLPVRRWGLPLGNSVTLPGVRVMEKEGRIFEPPPMQHIANANFDDTIQLLGYDLPVTSLVPGDPLPLTLVWQSRTSDIRASYTVFAHLIGPDGEIHAQADKVPGFRSKQPTTSWAMGEVITDPISIPLDPHTPPGKYAVQVGLYLAPDGPRLPLRDEIGTLLGDTLVLTQVEVANRADSQ